ncbi:hypothetical protein BS47DRAFT_1351665, partial [Hydnum rufescens UP504]
RVDPRNCSWGLPRRRVRYGCGDGSWKLCSRKRVDYADFEPIVEGSFGPNRTQILLAHTSDPNSSSLPYESRSVHALQFGLSGGEAPDGGCFPTFWGNEVLYDWQIYSVL